MFIMHHSVLAKRAWNEKKYQMISKMLDKYDIESVRGLSVLSTSIKITCD